MSPPVFLSHSSLDKQRFVVPFAQRLRDAGVAVWLDDWELLPGDSLIDRIFTDGISESDVVIVVLSANTADSNWVKNELNTAAIQRIKGLCRIVPVILDDTEVPPILQDTVYQKILDCSSYDAEFSRILDGLHNSSTSPQVGSPPAYIRESKAFYDDGLEPASRFILKQMVERGNDDGRRFFSVSDLEQIQCDGEFSDHQFRKEISRLERKGYIEARRHLGGGCLAAFIQPASSWGWPHPGLTLTVLGARSSLALSTLRKMAPNHPCWILLTGPDSQLHWLMHSWISGKIKGTCECLEPWVA